MANLIKDDRGDFPVMTFVITVVIALVVLGAALAMLGLVSPPTPTLKVTINEAGISGGLKTGNVILTDHSVQNFVVKLSVTDTGGKAVTGANCAISGLNCKQTDVSASSDKSLTLSGCQLPSGMSRAYLKVHCWASGYKDFEDPQGVVVSEY